MVLETTRRKRLALLETFKHETDNRNNSKSSKSKSSNLVTFEAIELTNKLAEAKAKLVQFGESDLNFFLMKVDAEKKAYTEQQAKIKSVITTKLTKEQLELEIRGYEKLYQGKEVAKDTGGFSGVLSLQPRTDARNAKTGNDNMTEQDQKPIS